MGYVRNTYGCHCFYGDSSFKRYNRAALGDTFIFNYNSNNTYNCCGGRRGGFWGGLGLGLGMGFGNLLGGLCGGLGNMFGGFGMGNMFGGFPSFGGFGNWGFGGTPAASTVKPSTKTVTVEKEVVKEVEKTNADLTDIDALSGKVAAALEKNKQGTLTQNDIDTLKGEIQAKLEGKFDGIQDELDKELLSKELRKLDAIKIGTPDANDISGIADKTDLSDDDINKLIAGFDKLTSEQKTKLKSGLETSLASLKRADDGYKVPRDYSSLLKLELLCKLDPSVVVYVETYNAASDQWIKGSIANVTKDKDGNINYWVDCKNTGDTIKAQWRFTTTENSEIAKITGTIADEKSYTARIGMSYDYNDDEGCYINNNKKVTAY